MSGLVALDATHHRDCYVLPERAQCHAAGLQLIPVVPAELNFIASQQPIVLTKLAHSGQFVLAALNGFHSGENLLYDDASKQWQGLYLPLQLQRQPFFLGQLHNDASATPADRQYSLCIDTNSPAVGRRNPDEPWPAGVEPLWQVDGSDSHYLHAAKQILAELLQGEQQRDQLIEQLMLLKLIQPLALEVTFADQSHVRLQGLYGIDQQRLAALPAEAVVSLHQAGYLPAVYSMIGSMAQLYPLINLKNRRLGAV